MKKIRMKKIMIIFLSLLHIQSLFASEYTTIPADQPKKSIVIITTSEALSRLALNTQDDWNVLLQDYIIKPSALAEYIDTETNTSSNNYLFQRIRSLQKSDYSKYHHLIEQTIAEIRNQEKDKSALNKLRQTFFNDLSKELTKQQSDIDTILPHYQKKKQACLYRAACNTTIALLIIGGWTLVGLFSWVADHCHHPWD
jgi:hypothetical protein